jgi:hypothetical protein
MTRTQLRSVFAVVLSAVLVVSTAGVGVAVPQETQGAVPGQSADDQQPADEAYVTEDGDVVLVYNGSSTETASGHLGVDLSTGLMHLLFNETVEDADDATGSASMTLTPDELVGEGELLAERPASVEDLSFSASGITTTEESHSSMTLDASFVQTGDSPAANPAALLASVETEGQITTTGTQFRSSGSATVSANAPMGADEMSYAVSLNEQDDGYFLEVSREDTVPERATDRWASEAAARQTVQSQFGFVAQQLGGEVSVDIESYSFDSDTRKLDIEYSVTLSGVKEAAADQLATMLVESPAYEFSESDAQEIADQIKQMELTELSGSVDVTESETTAEWTVQIDNYDQALLAALELNQAVATMAGQPTQMNPIDRSMGQLEAQREANLTRIVTWDGDVSTSEGEVDVSMTAEQQTENWEAYVSEVEQRENVSIGGDTEFEMAAQTDGDEIRANASFSLSQDGLINQSIDRLEQQTTGTAQPFDWEESPIETFQRADFEKAKMDVSVDEERVSVEAGASFENATEFRGLFEGVAGDEGTLQSVYSEPKDDQGLTYVRIDGAVSAEPTESEVRDLTLVGEDTAVYLPADWDEDQKSFPTPDTEEARSYLELDEGTEGESMEMMVPIAVGGGTALALAGGAVIGLRRRA